MKNFLLSICAFLLLCVSANASTIVLDSKSPENAQYVSLTAGEWTVEAIKGETTYFSWNAWGNTNGDHGWINNYHIDDTLYTDGTRYKTSIDAFDNAVKASFTLDADREVKFWISDSNYTDNIGSITLNITAAPVLNQPTAPAPEPATMLLFGIGLLGLAGVNRRK